MNFTSIDFETASRENGSACAIGIVKVTDSVITDEYYSLIKPFSPYFEPGFERIHGLSWDDVKDAPSFQELWAGLRHYFTNQLVVAHNASFDIGVLRSALTVWDLQFPTFEYNCTVSIAKKTWPEFYNHKLNTIAHNLDLELQHHHALEDARAAANIILKASEIHNAFSNKELLATLNLTNGLVFPKGYITPAENRKRLKKQS